MAVMTDQLTLPATRRAARGVRRAAPALIDLSGEDLGLPTPAHVRDAAKRALATGAKPGSLEFRAALRQALFATKEVVGTQGVYTYTPADRHGVDDRARILVQIEDGKYKLLP